WDAAPGVGAPAALVAPGQPTRDGGGDRQRRAGPAGHGAAREPVAPDEGPGGAAGPALGAAGEPLEAPPGDAPPAGGPAPLAGGAAARSLPAPARSARDGDEPPAADAPAEEGSR